MRHFGISALIHGPAARGRPDPAETPAHQHDDVSGDVDVVASGTGTVSHQAPQPTPAQRELGLALCRLRLEHGLSYRVHARRLGYSAHSMFVDIERGRRLPSEPLVRAYEKHFGLAPGSLAGLRRRALVERADQVTGERLREAEAASNAVLPELAARTAAETAAGTAAGTERGTGPARGGWIVLNRSVLVALRLAEVALDAIRELLGGPEIARRVADRASTGF